MGKNNRARRASKAKQRQRRGTPRSRGEQRGWGGPGGPDAEVPRPSLGLLVGETWSELVEAVRRGRSDARALAGWLVDQPDAAVDREVEAALCGTLTHLWAAGWQPAELRRQVRRASTVAAARLCELLILAEDAGHTGRRVDARWVAQLREFDSRGVSLRAGALLAWRAQHGVERAPCYLQAAELLVQIASLPVLDVLMPPPGSPVDAPSAGVASRAGAAIDPVLARIRKLLSKAESTEFEAEAGALTEKAQELMTRHAIDLVAVSESEPDDVPRLTRLAIDAPYADGKTLLLGAVAASNRCRTISIGELGMATIIGHEGDLRVVELLFTSLLVQAQNALREAGRDPRDRRSRTPAFRSSFFIGFAHRIGERLDAVNVKVMADVGGSALPVLRSREDAVEAAFEERFGGKVRYSSVRGGWDVAGSALGRLAADEAKLDSGELLR